MLILWGLAFLISFGLRFWGSMHPAEFLIRPVLLWFIIFAPSLFIGLLLFLNPQGNKKS